MANEIYHRSNWGNAVNDIAWGDTYEKFDATNEMLCVQTTTRIATKQTS